jgi:DMSO/TMAO reductase YedYZ molybdopterin-dependent catalytic subunit
MMVDDDGREAAPTKLTETKTRWAQELRFLGRPSGAVGSRLPPGQHLVRNWPVLDLGEQPKIAREQWQLRVWGAVRRPASWDWAAMMRMPQTHRVTDMHCVTTWSRYDNDWDGVTTRELAAATEPLPEARFVVLHAYDGYTTNLPVGDFLAEDAMLVHGWSGAPLTREHGGPARIVVPHLYLWKSAKWVSGIEFVTRDRPGFWEERGYHDRGDPMLEQRYSQPD